MSTPRCHFVQVTAPAALEDQLTLIFWELGYAGAVEEPLGDTVRRRIFFAPETDLRVLQHCAALCAAVDSAVAATVESQVVEDWSAQWKQFFKPVTLSKSLVITTDGVPHPLAPGLTAIVIVAGMAFGTGQHPTTQLIARAIAADFPERRWDRLLDVGCGTGILGLVAAAAGVTHVDGMDIDPEALVCANENILKNNMLHIFTLSKTLDEFKVPYPCIVSNILLDPLVDLAPRLTALLAAGGDIYLSGILQEQAEQLKNAYEGEGLHHVRTEVQGEWVMLHLKK